MIKNIRFTCLNSEKEKKIENNTILSKRSLLKGHPTQKIDEICERMADINDKAMSLCCSNAIVYKNIIVMKFDDYSHTVKIIEYLFDRIISNPCINFEIVYEEEDAVYIAIMYAGMLRYFLNLSVPEIIKECSVLTTLPIEAQVKIVMLAFLDKDYNYNARLFNAKKELILPPVNRNKLAPIKVLTHNRPINLYITPSPPPSRSPSPAIENVSFLKKIRNLCTFE